MRGPGAQAPSRAGEDLASTQDPTPAWLAMAQLRLAPVFTVGETEVKPDSSPVCVILGAGPGNGAALARKFTSAGYRVALLARDTSRLTTLAATLPGASAFACDVADAGMVEDAFAAVRRSMGSIEVMIYNAGKGVWGDVLSLTNEDFESAWRINTYGSFLASRQALPEMLTRGQGVIIFIGATASRRGAAGAAAFAAAKGGQRMLAESMARSYGPKGVHVSLVVVDAVVDEPLMRARLHDRPDEFFCRPDDIAETALMLARQAPSAWTFELEVRPFGEKW